MGTQQMLLTGQAVWLLSPAAVGIAVNMSRRLIMRISGFCLRDMLSSVVTYGSCWTMGI